MRKPDIDLRVFKKRREKLAQHLNGDGLVLFSQPTSKRNSDVSHAYRQCSNFYYLTGFEEPHSIFIFRPGKDPETVLFVQKKDKERETWDGFRYGPEGAIHEYGMSKGYNVEAFLAEAPILLSEVKSIHFSLFQNKNNDHQMGEVVKAIKSLGGRTGRTVPAIKDPDALLGEMRLIKEPEDLREIEHACDISAEAHMAAMRFARPGVNERDVHAVLIHAMMRRGSSREAYNSIVASGNSATTLHYVFNDQTCKNGDLLLIDAAAEYNYYASDITRTFPVNGRFSEVQKALYKEVLRIQKFLIEQVRPGVSFRFMRGEAVCQMAQLMLDLGLFTGTLETLVSSEGYKRYYPHGVGHWLGMDVHDVGTYYMDGDSRVLEPGMVFTVEPGLYIPADDGKAPTEYLGIGIRIEDNILVTEEGHRVLTAKAPKEIHDLEGIVGTG